MLCLSLVVGVTSCSWMRAEAQSNFSNWFRPAKLDAAKPPQLPEIPQAPAGDFISLTLPSFQYHLLPSPFIFSNDTVELLQGAIAKRLGIRYRFTGMDDRGYDCSGFVWRVFRDAGADFNRVAARTLWRQLPAAAGDEARQFGTLVFFNGLKHIGIVRDASTFYHSSRSQGVTLSEFAGYWEKRITGFRRAPMEILPPAPEPPKYVE